MKLIELLEGDITRLEVDAIVNAANTHLQHGGGVAWAIASRGGKVIQDESDRIGYVPTGSAAATSGGDLPCRYVIHAVGPKWGEGDEDQKLASATRAALQRAEELELRSLAYPAISAGIYGFPIDRCARVMLREVQVGLEKTTSVHHVIFCLFGQRAYETFLKAYEELGIGK